jgi:hypothetical protein
MDRDEGPASKRRFFDIISSKEGKPGSEVSTPLKRRNEK